MRSRSSHGRCFLQSLCRGHAGSLGAASKAGDAGGAGVVPISTDRPGRPDMRGSARNGLVAHSGLTVEMTTVSGGQSGSCGLRPRHGAAGQARSQGQQ